MLEFRFFVYHPHTSCSYRSSSLILRYSGTAGDSMQNNHGFGFSTFDVDNDGSADKHCALT